MDPQKLIDLLRATMDQQLDQRKAAEDQLTQVSEIFIPISTTWHELLTLGFLTKTAEKTSKNAFSVIRRI